jgi:uncharacterized OB-fold protein
MNTATQAEPLIFPAEWHVRYRYPVGETATRFFAALREKRIMATRCRASGISYLPPRAYCERSFEPCDEWVEAGHGGVIEAATIVSAAFENLPAPPYAIAYVRLDGVDTALVNFVRGLALDAVEEAAQKLRPGARVRVVFNEEPQGRITDFHYVLVE